MGETIVDGILGGGVVSSSRGWGRWEKPCSPAEVREIEAAAAVRA